MSEARRYWLALFSPATWQTLRAAGTRVAGFREARWLTVKKIRPGDYLLCYLTGVSRFNAALAVLETPYFDPTPIWPEDPLPARVRVKPVVILEPETALPVAELRDRLSVFQNLANPAAWTARLRRSPVEWPAGDGETVLEALLDAQIDPVVRELDHGRLGRAGRGLRRLAAGPDGRPVNVSGFREPASHSEVQWLLLKLGSDLGLDLWVARNDRRRSYAGNRFADLPRLLDTLPRQFDPATMATVEHIDVLWLKGGAIVAAFEVESTTAVYSGLLRMADLTAMQPNLNIPLYVVAPDRRRGKVMAEVNRPAFARFDPPLSAVCRYIPFSALRLQAQQPEPVRGYLKPEFIDALAEPCRR